MILLYMLRQDSFYSESIEFQKRLMIIRRMIAWIKYDTTYNNDIFWITKRLRELDFEEKLREILKSEACEF